MIETIGGTGNPGIHIAFHAYNESKIAAQMESGEIDLLIGSERMLPQTMKARKLYDERFVQLQRKGHPRGKRALDLEEYCSLDHLLVSISGGSFHGVIDEHLEKMHISEHSDQSFPLCCFYNFFKELCHCFFSI
ncbi:TPA: hypothetical protein O6E21_000259 [Vibrio cholerae]|nr:hypothetical protein [Vibrio cholerae]